MLHVNPLWHVGSSSLTRDQTWAPLHCEWGVLATRSPGKSQHWLLNLVLVKRNCPIGGGGSRNVARLRDIKEHSFLRHGELNMYQGMALCEISVRTNAQRPREVMLYPKDSEGPCRCLSRRECKMRNAFDFIRSDRSQVKTLTRRFLAQRMGCSSVL